jgi:DNA invertase Pin-like site-specific DNA recombinase
MQCVAYCRVSTTGQSEEGVSLEMQRSRIAAWCEANGYQQEAVFVEALSGGKASNRPELQKALALACKVKGVLVVYSLSRLARSVKDTLAIAERLEKAGANLASLTERIDTNSALGKMVVRLLSTLNEFEKDTLSERTTGAMAHLRRANRRISPRIPFGYDLAADGQTLLPNAAEQATLARICSWRSEGKTLAAIAAELDAAGVPTKLGGRWGASSVRSILGRQERIAA